MNTKLLVGGGVTAALGALMGWAVTADFYEKRLRDSKEARETYRQLFLKEKRVSDQLMDHNRQLLAGSTSDLVAITLDETPKRSSQDILKEAREEALAEGKTDDEDVVDSDSENSPGEDSDEKSDSDEPYLNETPEETRSNLQSLINKYTADENEIDEFVNSSVVSIEHSNKPPYVITQADYAWSEEGDEFDKSTLTYFETFRILVDEDDELIEDIAATVGWRALSRFGDDSGDPDTVFVRNPRLLTDFEVVRELEAQPPLHVRYGMPKVEFGAARAAGLIKLRPEDQ